MGSIEVSVEVKGRFILESAGERELDRSHWNPRVDLILSEMPT